MSHVLAGKHIEAKPRDRGNTIIVCVRNDLQQLGRAIAALGRNDAEFGQMSADRVAQHRALTHQQLPGSVQHQSRLLLLRLDRHKPHRRPRHRLADRRRIVGVILAALEIGLHIARRHQPHRVPERLQLAAPMMRCRTGFDANQTWRQAGKELQNLRATDTLADHHRAITIDPVNLKH